MKLSIGFRRAERADVEFLLLLRKLSMTEHLNNAGYPSSEQDHLNRITEYFTDSFIIIHDNTNIGLIKLGLFSDRIHIRQFQILPSLHRKGIGGNVIEIVKKKALELKLPITLNVLIKNPAHALYVRHGFYVDSQDEVEYKMRWNAF